MSGCRSCDDRSWRDVEDLQADRVACFETAGGNAFGRLPSWGEFVVLRQIRRGVESQPGNDRVSVAVARVNRDPFAAPAFAILAKFRGTDRRFE